MPEDYEISEHAQEQIVDREVPPELFEQVLRNPEQIITRPDARFTLQSRVKWQGRDYLLRIVAATDVDPVVIVTVYFTSRIEKYWASDHGTQEGTP